MKSYLLKKVFSIFLISLISLQWFFGLITIDLVEQVWVDQKLSERKLKLSDKVTSALGVSNDIELEEISLHSYVRMGYGAPFVVTHEVEGEELYFKVAQNEVTYEYQIREIKINDFNKESSKKLGYFISHIFLNFIESHEDFEFYQNGTLNQSTQPKYDDLVLTLPNDIPTPPPEFFV
ncbi:hypothetical protein GCM10011506_42600 [Marivirga lumbricoides]|uniref:Uncharacterized protein n=1 Tax=Marivirga lumbricoides TaxID=1046115 RepID=A0ABQ1N328_9BACT|nr:hypothetical protein GCM10011506_42600 [Marivirga lumbricoides]